MIKSTTEMGVVKSRILRNLTRVNGLCDLSQEPLIPSQVHYPLNHSSSLTNLIRVLEPDARRLDGGHH